jgi:hypothetical protein
MLMKSLERLAEDSVDYRITDTAESSLTVPLRRFVGTRACQAGHPPHNPQKISLSG